MPNTALVTSGSVLTATEFNYLPRGVIDWAKNETGQGSITTVVTDITGLSLSISMVSGRTYRTTIGMSVASTVANDIVDMTIRSASATLATNKSQLVRDGNGFWMTLTFMEDAASTATVTRKASIVRAFGTGTITVVASSTVPAFISVEDLGVA